TISFSPASSETPSSATMPPKRRLTFSTSRRAATARSTLKRAPPRIGRVGSRPRGSSRCLDEPPEGGRSAEQAGGARTRPHAALLRRPARPLRRAHLRRRAELVHAARAAAAPAGACSGDLLRDREPR